MINLMHRNLVNHKSNASSNSCIAISCIAISCIINLMHHQSHALSISCITNLMHHQSHASSISCITISSEYVARISIIIVKCLQILQPDRWIALTPPPLHHRTNCDVTINRSILFRQRRHRDRDMSYSSTN